MEKKTAFLIFVPILVLGLLFLIEQVIAANYIMKSFLKIFLMVGSIFLYSKLFNTSILKNISLARVSKKTWIISFCRGFTYFALIILCYFILSNFIDFQSIIADLQTRLGITPFLFIFVGLYITLVNSFLEESFFRGFIFLELFEKYPMMSNLYSSFLFAIYHIGIFLTWASWELIVLSALGLFFVGFIFCLLDTKSQSIIPSWTVHVLADAGIIIVGLLLFGIL